MVCQQIQRSERVARSLRFELWILCVVLSFFVGLAGGQDHRPDELVIGLRAGGNINLLARLYGFQPLERLDGTETWRVRVSGPLQDVLQRVQADRTVEFAELNYILATPEAEQESMAFLDAEAPAFIEHESPPRYFDQPAAGTMMIEAAQTISTGRGVTVAVVDTGISFTHPALAARALDGRDFVDGDFDPTDEPGGVGYGHGTFVSGLIVRVAPDAMILPLRALDPSGRGDTFTIAKAVRYGVDPGRAHIINLSLGLPRRARVVDAAVRYAASRNVVVVASAGNQNSGMPQYPAAHPDALSVAAVDNNDIKAGFSNFHATVGVSAPGVEVYSTFPTDQFASWSGTSFSAAFVSGEAAMVRALYPKESLARIKTIIQQDTENIDALNPNYVGRLGGGRVNCLLAVQ